MRISQEGVTTSNALRKYCIFCRILHFGTDKRKQFDCFVRLDLDCMAPVTHWRKEAIVMSIDKWWLVQRKVIFLNHVLNTQSLFIFSDTKIRCALLKRQCTNFVKKRCFGNTFFVLNDFDNHRPKSKIC